MVFNSDGILKILPGGDWQLTTPLVYVHPVYGEIIVPAGFITDLASIPRLCHRIVNPCTTGTRRPAIVHDYLYSGATNLTRKEADLVLYDALRECGINWAIANSMYYAVRTFGGQYWRGVQ